MTSVTRRRLLQCSSLAALASVSSAAISLGVTQAERDLLEAPVEIPANFLGMHLHRWPEGTPLSPAPSYGYGAVRSHDYSGRGSGICWAAIHRADGVFDWSAMDAWVAAHRAAGKTLIYTVYGTPAWLAWSSTQKDAYGNMGAGSPPRSLEALAEFIETLIRRYNRPGSRSIGFVEIWNEPYFEHNPINFWWGSAQELATMGRVIYQSAKHADPLISVLSPGFDDNLTGAMSFSSLTLAAARSSPLYQYLSAPDGAGGRGGDWCDAIAFHTYEAVIQSASTGIEGSLILLRAMLYLMKLSLPLYCTECGFRLTSSFAASSVEDQASALRRLAAVLAASRVEGLYFYAHEDKFIGDPSHHRQIGAALSQIQEQLAGSTLRQVTVLPGGAVRVHTEHQTFLC